MKNLTLTIILTLILLSGCSRPAAPDKVTSTYTASLMWDGLYYNLSNNSPIPDSSIGLELGKITREVSPMPQKDGEVNTLMHFNLGDRLFTMKDVETTEAIAVMSGGKYYKLFRSRCSMGVVCEDRVYDFLGNYDNEQVTEKLGSEIGQVKRLGIVWDSAVNGDLILAGSITPDDVSSIFKVGGRICLIEGLDQNKAIAVEGKDGRFHKAVYIKRVKK